MAENITKAVMGVVSQPALQSKNIKTKAQKVDNSNATGREKIYRTKAYTYVQSGDKLMRVPGATPVEGVSVVHGPPPAALLNQVNKTRAPKGKKISLSTTAVLVIAMIYVMTTASCEDVHYVFNGQCFGNDVGACYWISQNSVVKRCARCTPTDGKKHIIVGSNDFDSSYNRLIYINTTTGDPSDEITIGRLAPLIPGTLLFELYYKYIKGEMTSVNRLSLRVSELHDGLLQDISTLRQLVDSEKANRENNAQTFLELHKQSETKLQKVLNSMENNVKKVSEIIGSIASLSDNVSAQNSNTQNLETRVTALENTKASLIEHASLRDQLTLANEQISILAKQHRSALDRINDMNENMQHLVMDAVNTLMHKQPEVIIDYGVSAASTPPLIRTVRQIKTENADKESEDTNRAENQEKEAHMLRINYGGRVVALGNDITQYCSCANGVLKMCNVEIKFNSTRMYKPEEAAYCLVKADLNRGVLTKRERLMCKQSEIRDACALSVLVGRAISLQNVTAVKIFKNMLHIDDSSLIYSNKLITDICEFADESRPYKLTALSKYRPIFVACNITLPDNIPRRNTNRLHYLVSTLALVLTFVIELIYQSWIVGVELLVAAVLGFVVVVEDALLSESIEARNYATLVVLASCFAVVTMSRTISLVIYVGLLSWLYTVEAIDGMTFNVVGTQTPNKIIYETSLNMHASDTIMMGNVSLTLRQIRQRREYDYAYTLPRQIAYKQLCYNWDCTNTAPNCVNKCDADCDALKHHRCTSMSMYNSCVWSPLGCALCEGTGALFETLCFSAVETCHIYDSPSNQGDREVVLNYNVDGRTEEHIVKVGQDAYASGGIFKITQLEILSTQTIGTVARCGAFTWCRKQKLQTKDFCGWYGMESNASQIDPLCLRIKDTRSYADGHAISSKLEYRANNFEPTQFGFRECTADEVESEDNKTAIVWTTSPGARLNIYHEQELDSVTTQLCDEIETLTVSSVVPGQKHAFKVSTVTMSGSVEQECLVYITAKHCYVLGRNDYLLRADFTINITMTCTIWSSDTIYVSGSRRYDVSATNIAVDPTYYVEKSWSTNTNNNTLTPGTFPIEAMTWLLTTVRWFAKLTWGLATNVLAIIAIAVAIYAILMLHDQNMYLGITLALLIGFAAYVRAEDEKDEPEYEWY